MPYIPTFERTQMMMCSGDSFVAPESIARLIDAFVNSLELTKYGIKKQRRKAARVMTQKGCINCTSMGVEKEFVLHENWLKAVKSILK